MPAKYRERRALLDALPCLRFLVLGGTVAASLRVGPIPATWLGPFQFPCSGGTSHVAATYKLDSFGLTSVPCIPGTHRIHRIRCIVKTYNPPR